MHRIVENISQSDDSAECHLVPCKISYDGPARVSTYFQPEKGIAYFRGRKLLGETLGLEQLGLQGALLQKAEAGWQDEAHYVINRRFVEFHVWEHESRPQNAWTQMRDWSQVSRAIHGIQANGNPDVPN